MAGCVTKTSKNVLKYSSKSIDECNGWVILTKSDYQAIQSENTFDPALYDMGYEAVITSFVIGIGIGWVLAIISKIKR